MSIEDDMAVATAAIDQMNAVMRDAFAPAVAQFEKQLLGQGASRDLAMWVSLEYFERLMNMAELGKAS